VWLLALAVRISAQPLPQPSNETPPSSIESASAYSAKHEPRPVSWKLLAPNILRDQKDVWLFPVKVARGQHLTPVLGIVAVTAGMVALDPEYTPYFRHTTSFSDFNRILSGRNTTLTTAVVPLTFYAVGLARKDSYARETALLAGEAVAGSEILTAVMKSTDRRLRPADIPPNGDYSHTWFQAHSRMMTGHGSFPSGHTIAAFSVATVFADRYRQHRWAPWVAYSLASLVGISRVTLQSHFASDVFVGAVLGYAISHYVVMRR
jgi:membrane-associated phospholipid phosphatase